MSDLAGFDSRTLALLNRLASRKQREAGREGGSGDSHASRPSSAVRTGLSVQPKNFEFSGRERPGTMNIQGRVMGHSGNSTVAARAKAQGALDAGIHGSSASSSGAGMTPNMTTHTGTAATVGSGGDGVFFAESAALPGVIICYRSREERQANPERLNLDKRKLVQCPLLDGEERLRLLNYQNNLITRITNMNGLPNLIFLDLYNNQIRTIEGLDILTTLRVLMLGKNLLRSIQNLQSLTRLDVLDLHSNNIERMECLEGLVELRVLNLAGNCVSVLAELGNLPSLTELNLRRNSVERVITDGAASCLQRLFLSNNKIRTMQMLDPLFGVTSLTELSLDGNPVFSASGYRSVMLEHLPSLRHLDLKRVTDDERRGLSSAKAPAPAPAVETVREAAAEQRLEAIRLAQQDWEEGLAKAGSPVGKVRRGVGEVSEDGSSAVIYGPALELLDRYTGLATVTIRYVLFSQIKKQALPKLISLPNLRVFRLDHNSLEHLWDANSLSDLKSVSSLHVGSNAVQKLSLWRPFILSRLPHLDSLDGVAVTPTERAAALARMASLQTTVMKVRRFATVLLVYLMAEETRPQVGSSWTGSQLGLLAATVLRSHSFHNLPSLPVSTETPRRASPKTDSNETSTNVVNKLVEDVCSTATDLHVLSEHWENILTHYKEKVTKDVVEE